MCPLKEAARDAPNQLALLGDGLKMSFAELDAHVDKMGSKSPFVFAQMLFAWRNDLPFFPINPKLPIPPTVKNAPPQSLLIRTSGSTSEPKIAILSKQSLIINAMGTLKPLQLNPNDQWKLTLPLYHVGGIGTILRCLLAKATIVLTDSPNITHLSCVPTHLYRATPIYKHLKCLLVGGAPIPSYPYPISSTYGLTEMGSMVTLNGEILPDREVKLSDTNEILVRGPCLFQGYMGKPKIEGWFATGDLGQMIDGKLHITGRKDWMFISGGENIQPEEIEKELLKMPNSLEAIVVGKDDPEFGKRPVAFMHATKAISKQEMQMHLSQTLPKFKIPIELYIVDEIPRKNNLKVDRLILSQIVNNK